MIGVMPSPFPGMDPYLESPRLWPDLHQRLIGRLGAALTPRLRPSYYALVESRTYIPDADDAALHVIEPDLQLLERSAASRRTRAQPTNAAGGLAVAEAVDVTDLFPEELTEHYLAVIDARTRDLVTVIELVSPSNKVRGSAGRRSIVAKHADCAAAGVNWLEIDLLRGGERVTVPRSFETYAYRVLRDQQTTGSTRRRQAWPFALSEVAPVIGVPLRAMDGEVPLDVQAALDATYEDAGYDLMVDYAADPPAPPLSAEDAAWADAVLREAKLRG